MTQEEVPLADRFQGFDRANAFVAFGVWVTAFIVYLATMAPTVTFWDCGEFIAASHVLGIPHPPGTPLFVMFGRLAAIIPLFTDAAARINFLSVICSSLAVLFGYLAGVRILRQWFVGSQSPFSRFLTYAGAASGALFLAFSFTQWGNAIEAEVYGMAMLLFLVILWLTLIYYQQGKSKAADRTLLAIVYLSVMSIGVHMATFVIFPISAIFFIFKRETPVRFWFVAAAALAFELYLIFALSSRANEVPYYVPVVVMLVLYLLYVFSMEKTPRGILLFAGGFLVAIAPVYGVIYRVLQRAGDVATTTPDSSPVLNVIGIAGFCALIAFAVWNLVQYMSRKNSNTKADSSLLISSVMVLVAALMVVLLVANIRGYAVFLVLSVVLVGGLGVVMWRYIRLSIFLAVAAVGLIIIGVYPFLIGMGVVAVLLLVAGVVGRLPEWRTGILILVMATLGFSVHVFLPVRSSQNPSLDQTKTSESIKTTIAFIERKQYGSEPMMQRMFHRRAEWDHQFGVYHRMGFWRFFDVQYGVKGPKFFALFVLGILGMWEAVRRKPRIGLALTLLILVCSIGLVLYMNFSDGTRMNSMGGDYIEVRDRDYFWTPAFMLFGLAIGIGVAALLQTVRDGVARFATQPRRLILGAASVLFLLPIFALAGNYHEVDRSNNYIAYDYAANLLRSAEKDAVLFVYGDNDTFPLWALQEAFGVRTDVKLINLSLSTTKWYIKQIQEHQHLDLGWSDQQIDALRNYRLPDGRTFGLDGQVIDAVIDHNFPQRTVEFSSTVPESARDYHGSSASPYLLLTGLNYKFTGVADNQRVDVDESMRILNDPERFSTRGLNDPAVFKDDNMIRMCGTYGTAFLVVADSLRKARRYAEAERFIKYGIDRILPENDLYNMLATVYAEQGKTDQVQALIDSNVVKDKHWLQLMIARTAREKGDTTNAERLYLEMLQADPHYRQPLEDLSRIYNERLEYGKLRALFSGWMKANPNDPDVARLVKQLDDFMLRHKLDSTAKDK